jgi:hypothetical protein
MMAKKKTGGIKSFIKRMARDPILKTFFVIIPMIWNPVMLEFWGEDLGFIDKATGSMTEKGIIATAITFISIGIFLLITNIYVYCISVHEENYSSMVKKLLPRIHELYKTKLDKLLRMQLML